MKNRDRNVTGGLSRGALAALLAVTLSGAAFRPGTAFGETRGVDSLVVLHTNDVHSHLDPFVVAGGATVGGAAARAALIEREKARGGRVLVLDGGDLVQGTPYYNRFRGEPDHKILDSIGYDAIALGNHDLDDGAAPWRKREDATRTPILSANVFVATDALPNGAPGEPVPAPLTRGARWVGGEKVRPGADLRHLATPYVVVERDGVKIGILGLTTYSLDRIVAVGRNEGVAVGDPVAAARYYVPILRRQADIVIALTHLGVDQDRRLVDRVPGIDLVIGGHSHTPLFRPTIGKSEGEHAVPIAQAGSWGRYVGRTTLRWKDGVRTTAGRLIEVAPAQGENARVEALLAGYRERLGGDLDRVVYRSPDRVETSGLSDLDHPLGNFVSDVIRERMKADIAIMNAGGIRAPLPEGDVRERDILSMLPFDNHLVTVSMTGSQVRRLLDRFARRLGKSGFGHASGLSYTIVRDRAMDVRVWRRQEEGHPWKGRSGGPGEPLDGNRVYRVATIDFLANGGDYFDELKQGSGRETTDILLSDAAMAFLREHPTYRFAKDGRVQWRGSSEALRDLRVR